MSLLITVASIVFLVGPILGIVAFVRLKRLEAGGLGDLAKLTRRVTALEEKLAGAGVPGASVPQPSPSVSRPAAEAVRPPGGVVPPWASGPARPAKPVRPALDLESLIAGRWLNRVGLLLVFLAAFFALKWEFDNDVLGPTGRVALWTLIGAALLLYGQWLLGRGLRYLSEGLTGLGGAVLYLTLYFAWDSYQLLPQAVAFLAMVLVTGALLAIAIGRDSQRIALLGLIGGFLTPLLTGADQDAQVVLFSYLLILNSGLLVLARARGWRGIEPLAFGFTVGFFWTWFDSFYRVSEPLGRTAAFASLFFVIFAALPVIVSRTAGRLFPEQVVQTLLNAGNYLLALYMMLWPAQRWTLTAAVVTLAALHLLVARAIPPVEQGAPAPRILFAGLALTFVTLAIPIRLGGAWITIAWAVEGAVLIWSGFNARWRFLRAAGFALYGIAVYRLMAQLPSAEAFLLNARFGAFAVAIASFLTTLYRWRRQPEQLDDQEGRLFSALGVGVNVLAVWALSLEVDQYFNMASVEDAATTRSAELSRQVTMSLLWTVYATGLVVAGVRSGLAGVRWQGLALFGLVAGKVFFFDLSLLSGGYRILSSIVLGIVLIAISVFYQRRVAAQPSGHQP